MIQQVLLIALCASLAAVWTTRALEVEVMREATYLATVSKRSQEPKYSRQVDEITAQVRGLPPLVDAATFEALVKGICPLRLNPF
jgi:hypothetical protein